MSLDIPPHLFGHLAPVSVELSMAPRAHNMVSTVSVDHPITEHRPTTIVIHRTKWKNHPNIPLLMWIRFISHSFPSKSVHFHYRYLRYRNRPYRPHQCTTKGLHWTPILNSSVRLLSSPHWQTRKFEKRLLLAGPFLATNNVLFSLCPLLNPHRQTLRMVD